MSEQPNKRVDVYVIQAGQPRPYADSFYEADLVFSNWWKTNTGEMRKGKWRPDEATVKAIARILVEPFADEPAWHDARLKSLAETEPGRWRVLVVQPYLD